METRVYECDSKDKAASQKILEADPYADVCFARQGYKMKEGKLSGGEDGKYYIYITGEPDFFKWAEEKFKEGNVASLKRSEKPMEAKVIAHIESEDNAAEAGFGAIFG